jgi:hypothetical protein
VTTVPLPWFQELYVESFENVSRQPDFDPCVDLGRHDWRLWKRAPSSRIGEDPKVAQEFGWRQTWYCTRCRKFEDRFAVVEGAFSGDVSEYARGS